MVSTKQAVYEQNKQQMVDHCLGGCKTDQEAVGLEFEHALVHKSDQTSVPYFGEKGIQYVLEKLGEHYPNHDYFEEDHLLGLSRPGETVTLEPAAFIELSLDPKETVSDVERAYKSFRSLLDPILDDCDIAIADVGYVTSFEGREMELIPRERYHHMDRYLGEMGFCGSCLLRASAATQVSIDYSSEKDALEKLRVANAFGPLLALITDNSPIFETVPTKRNMLRTLLWMNYDPMRCMVIPGSLSPHFSFEEYAEYVLRTPAILVPDTKEGWKYVGSKSFQQLYSDRVMTHKEMTHAFSMLFNDTRLTSYLEIRSADAMPLSYSLAYTALIKGIFYNPSLMGWLLDEIDNNQIDEQKVYSAKLSLMQDGYDASLYGRKASEWLDALLDGAQQNLGEEDAYIEPFSALRSRDTLLTNLYDSSKAQELKIPRIGILPRYNGDRTELSVDLGYNDAILQAGGLPFVLPSLDNPLFLEKIIENFDGFIIPGGHNIDPFRYGQKDLQESQNYCLERDRMELALVQKIALMNKPLLGVCRGTQVINVALGGTLCQDIEAKYPKSMFQHEQRLPYTTTVQSAHIYPDTKLSNILGVEELPINSIHNQCIDQLAEGLQANAKTDDGVVEGIESVDENFILGVQWHPEYLFKNDKNQYKIFKSFVDAAQEAMPQR